MKSTLSIGIMCMIMIFSFNSVGYPSELESKRCPFGEESDWSAWQSSNIVEGLSFRAYTGEYSESTGEYLWYIEWHNENCEDLYFDYSVTLQEESPTYSYKRESVPAQGYIWSWGLIASPDSISIWIDEVRLESDFGDYYIYV